MTPTKANTYQRYAAALPWRLINLLLLALMSGFSQYSSALPEDRNQPIHVASDRAQRDDNRGITTYEGGVEIIQGTLKILADKVTIYTKKEGVSKIIAVGKPAHYQQIPEHTKPMVVARATKIEYYVDKEFIKLFKNAFIKQQGSSLEGQQIDYNIATAIINANSQNANSKDDRVRTIIEPKKSP